MSWDDYAEGRPAKRRKIQPSLHKKTPTPQPFRFFDLPRELRDQIYDLMLHNRTNVPTHSLEAPELQVMNGPRSSALRVSTQFAQEYTEQMKRSTSLVIGDANVIGYDLALARIPFVLASNCTRLAVHTNAYDIEEIVREVDYLIKGFSCISTLLLKVSITPTDCRGSLEDLTRCHGVSEIGVFVHDLKRKVVIEAAWNSQSGGDENWTAVVNEQNKRTAEYEQQMEDEMEQIRAKPAWSWFL